MPALKTTLIWHNSRGDEREAEVTVTYNVTRGYAETHQEPGQGDEVEIERIVGMAPDVPSRFYEDDDLKQECYEDWRDRQEYAREQADEMRAERNREDW